MIECGYDAMIVNFVVSPESHGVFDRNSDSLARVNDSLLQMRRVPRYKHDQVLSSET